MILSISQFQPRGHVGEVSTQELPGAWQRLGVIAYLFWIAVRAIALLREPWRRSS